MQTLSASNQQERQFNFPVFSFSLAPVKSQSVTQTVSGRFNNDTASGEERTPGCFYSFTNFTRTKIPSILVPNDNFLPNRHCSMMCVCVCLYMGLFVHCRPCAVVSLCPAVSCTTPRSPRWALPLSPSDRLSLCREHFVVFESCQDVKRGRSPARRRASTRPAPLWKVRGNVASQSAPLIGRWRVYCASEGMDGSPCFSGHRRRIHSRLKGTACIVQVPRDILLSMIITRVSN